MKRNLCYLIGGLGAACAAFAALHCYENSYETWAHEAHMHCPYNVTIRKDSASAVCPHDVVIFSYHVPSSLASNHEKLLAKDSPRE